jgi:AcrR family transcriptional regulator
MEVFGSRGFRNGSLREIAERVGLTQPALIHHFGSKLGLFMEVLHWHASEAVAVQSQLPFKEEILAVVEHGDSNREFIRLFTTISSEATDPSHPAHEYWVARYREVQERWKAAIQAAQKDASIDPNVDADVAARLIIAALDGLNVQWLLGTTEEMRGDIAYLLAALVPSDLSARDQEIGNRRRRVEKRAKDGDKSKIKGRARTKATTETKTGHAKPSQ